MIKLFQNRDCEVMLSIIGIALILWFVLFFISQPSNLTNNKTSTNQLVEEGVK